jgi:hypothetical protein
MDIRILAREIGLDLFCHRKEKESLHVSIEAQMP